MTGPDYLSNLKFEFGRLKSLAEKGLTQITDDDFFQTNGIDKNSIAIIAKHIGGNLKSRFRDFLTTDGEKPDRNRDEEFQILPADSRDSLMQIWQTGWQTLTDTLNALEPDDLSKTVLIRGEEHTVIQAGTRSLTHIAYHVGQITLLCKQFAGKNWKTLSVAKGESEQFRHNHTSYLDRLDK